MPLFVLVLLALASCSAPPPPPTKPNAIAIRGATLIDGTGRAPVPASVVLIESGRISAAGPESSVAVPPGAAVVDAAGKFLIPGLMDLHVHLGATGGPGFRAEDYTPERVERNLNSYLYFGVTTVRSVGTEREAGLALRDRQRAGGPLTTARLFTAGRGFTAPGGHPSQEIGDIARQPRDPEDARRQVRELAAQKVDLIKIWIDTGQGRPRIERPITEAILAEAKQHGIPVVAHIRFEDDVRHLIANGGDGILHMIRDKDRVDPKLVDVLRERHVVFTPTLIRQELAWLYRDDPARLDDPGIARVAGAATIAKLREFATTQPAPTPLQKLEFDRALLNSKALADAGIAIAVGSDGGSSIDLAGLMTHRECELLVQAGLTPLQAITAATRNGALALHKETELGSIEPGRRADLVLLTADPTADIRNLRRIDRVMLDGAWVDRDGLKLF